MTRESTDAAYVLARQRYADLGVDTDAALRRLAAALWRNVDLGSEPEDSEDA